MEPSTGESSGSKNMIPRVVRLKSSDGEIFEVETEVAMLCKVVGSMMEDGCANDVIPLPNTGSKVLGMVIEWCRKRTTCNLSKGEVNQWDAEFMDNIEDQEVLFGLILAANYLNVELLLSRLCQKVARMMRGKSPEQIRQLFHITNDYTPEEEEQIRRENQWAFD
ncbi:hypothetical protein K2173_004125 [Erythroxylum novogranatense]|uniref:SKP1-like protein n=1 Tax=Erythroxylum novogranatense TaxID=1862640 RepID=A0AAV8SXS5_9ROSI|nr:hypothetical protein K2173_004125 [Erythroxylum novogranatense]